MRKRTVPIVFAALLASLHILFVAVPVLSSKASGEGQGMAVGFFDFPLAALLYYLPFLDFTSTRLGYTLTFCIGGTIMWAVVGALFGWMGNAFLDSIESD